MARPFNFLKKIILFLLPLALIFVLPAVVFYVGREYYAVKDVVKLQANDDKVVFGLAYTDLATAYKDELVAAKNPQVLVLGASRAVEFKREFFINSSSFANAGRARSGVDALAHFLKTAPSNSQTKVIILSLDPKEFILSLPVDNPVPNGMWQRWLNFFAGNWRQVYIDILSRKLSLLQLWQQNKKSGNIGLTALIAGDGFRSDGSYVFARSLSDSGHKQNIAAATADMLQAIKKRRIVLEYGNQLNEQVINSLASSLRLCRQRGITVIGFLPPRPSLIYQEMISDDYLYKDMVLTLPPRLQTIFSGTNFNFQDFSDISILDASDSEFVDPGHGTDKLYLRSLIYLAGKDKRLQQEVDLPKLKNMLNNSKRDFVNF